MTELDYVVPKLGTSLQAVEIGNELNLYNVRHPRASGIRSRRPFTARSRTRSSPVRAIFEDINYATKFINGEASMIDLVTHHYYRGQAGTSTATLANLINLDPAVDQRIAGPGSSVQTKRFAAGSGTAR